MSLSNWAGESIHDVPIVSEISFASPGFDFNNHLLWEIPFVLLLNLSGKTS